MTARAQAADGVHGEALAAGHSAGSGRAAWGPALGVLALGLVFLLPGPGRAADFPDLITGKTVPLTIALKDLTPEWRRLSVGGAAETQAGAAAGVYAAMLGGGSGQAYYTRGQTVTCGDQTFIVAYRPPAQALDFAALMQMQRGGKPPTQAQLTPDTLLSLALLHLQTIGHLSEVRAFDLARELADSAQAQDSQNAMLESISGARSRAVSVSSMSNLKQVGLGVKLYAEDHGQTLPPLTDAAAARDALKDYIKDETVFAHPQTKEPYQPNPSLSGKPLAGPDAVQTVVFYETSPAEDGGRTVLFLDGHVKHVGASNWAELKKASGIP